MTSPKISSILCVHQGSELYGSDRVFIQSVKAFKQIYPDAKITVHLPESGTLSDILHPLVSRVIVGDLFVLRLADLKPAHWKKLLNLPFCLREAWKNINTHDVIYINTVMIFSYLALLRFSKKKAVLHIHEYGAGITGALLQLLTGLSGASVIVNSKATADAYPNTKSLIVWNGIADMATNKATDTDVFKLLLVGRINNWKGHSLALDAIKQLKNEGFKNMRLDIIGDVFGDQKHYHDALVDQVKADTLGDHVFFHGFSDDTNVFYKQANAVLVPSIRPEPFGLVAVEGMMWGLPVIAANHGGLKEIIVHNQTGMLFQPNNSKSLAEAMRKYIVHPDIPIKHGNAGRVRYDALFTKDHYFKRFIEAIKQHVA